jgi:hypothetical protein
MPKYFFRLSHGRSTADTEGKEFDSLAEAVHHALVVARDFARNALREELEGRAVCVLDEARRELDRVPLIQETKH